MTSATNTLKIIVCREGVRDECRTYECDRTVTVGKDGSCDLLLNDRGVSRSHCRFAFLRGIWTVCDLGSTNGLTINGKELGDGSREGPSTPVALGSGDRIGVGIAVLKIELQTPSMDATEILTPKMMSELANPVTETLEPSASLKPSAPIQKSSVVPSPMNATHTVLIQPALSPKPNPEKPNPEKKSPLRQVAKLPPTPQAYKIVDGQTAEVLSSPKSTTRKLPCDFRNYSLRKKIGIGGMGEVYFAIVKEAPTTTHAIKFLSTHAQQSSPERAHFLREMEIASKLKHPFLVECYECGEEDGQLFIAMAYCNGGNLTEFLSRVGMLSVRRALRLMYRLLDGVDEAHRQGIVHRDLKPSNILLHRAADGLYFPKISDFGLAKSFLNAGESGMTLNGTVGGSFAYMPKEQVLDFRYVLPQSDVWSLGAILYECLTNRVPRPIEKGRDPIRTILESKLVPIEHVRKDLPKAFTSFLATALEVDVDNRYRDAGEMRSALQRVAVEIGVDL